MYHVIGDHDERPERFVVPIGTFERQMAWLARLRFNVLRLEEAVTRLAAGEALPRRAVSLTFDDGTRDLLTRALPVLERYGFPATAFVVTHAMGGTVTWTERPGIAGQPVLTWEETRELGSLVTLQPHTRTHPSLVKLADEQLAAELRGSREDLEARTGAPHALFAYPYGDFDERVAAAVANAGYTAAVTVRRGVNTSITPPFRLHRYEVAGDASPFAFARILAPRRQLTR
jgi:peptidoglycan/xylan/chitin deacetylase (PgdA/CDA1 family)